MLPVSYRASSVYYVQRDFFIVFKNADVALLLGVGRRAELLKTLMRLYEFPGGELNNDEILRQLKQTEEPRRRKHIGSLSRFLTFCPRQATPPLKTGWPICKANISRRDLLRLRERNRQDCSLNWRKVSTGRVGTTLFDSPSSTPHSVQRSSTVRVRTRACLQFR